MPRKKLSFNHFDVAHLDQILPCLELVFRKHEIDFFILGGLARDIHLVGEGLRPRRITRDIDVATLIPDPANYEQLISDLIMRQDFEDVKGNPVRLRHSTGVVVDILPFNKWTTSKDKTVFGPAFAEFNLEGLNEVFHFGTGEVIIEENHRFRVTTPEAIILLKFLSYEDRPEWRQKDIEDIGQLIQYYFDLNDEEIYRKHNDLFGDERSLEAISGRVIGRKLRPLLLSNNQLFKAFQSVLEKHVREPSSKVVILLSRELGANLEEIKDLLKEIQEGIIEGSPTHS